MKWLKRLVGGGDVRGRVLQRDASYAGKGVVRYAW